MFRFTRPWVLLKYIKNGGPMKINVEKYKSILYNIDSLAGITGIGIGAVMGLFFYSEAMSDVLAIACIFGLMFAGMAMMLHSSVSSKSEK